MRTKLGITIGLLMAVLGSHYAVADEKVKTERAYTKATYSEEREPCKAYYPERKAWFGDLHVHTGLSQDASTQGTINRPDDAYRFAKGAKLGVQPYDKDGKATRFLQLEKPLDFAAITDHAEQLGEVAICNNPELEGHKSLVCRLYRSWPRGAFFLMNSNASQMGGERFGFCGEKGENCLKAAKGPWNENIAATEAAYDKSENCSFTGFIGYEWTGAQDLANTHRNVIFRNNVVPDLPVSFTEANYAQDLWRLLDGACDKNGQGCQSLVIPHNSNLSDGFMFQLKNPDGSDITEAQARERSFREPLVEVMQHKGSSECYFGKDMLVQDELCEFEQLPYDRFEGKFVSFRKEAPTAKVGFLREVLRDGYRQERKTGANPFQFGFIASTDTHMAAPGAVDEKSFIGHGGAGNPAEEGQVSFPDDLEFNPGGLAVIWAEENSRDALFDGMMRKETYGTSGPRIQMRFFAGEDLPKDMCAKPDFPQQGYANGVPMGGGLTLSDGASPMLAVASAADANGNPLQQIQIIKGWVDTEGNSQEKIVGVAGNPDNGASVDTNTCKTSGQGYQQLCSLWKDNEFSAGQKAWYYARAVENPSCRWSQHFCLKQGVDCANPKTIKKGLEQCCSVEHRPVIQERAWSSPIWVK